MAASIEQLPTPLLTNILKLLPPKQLIACRGVSTQWKGVVDGLTKDTALWKRHFLSSFKPMQPLATSGRLSWFQKYKALSLWPHLLSGRRTVRKVCLDETGFIESFQVVGGKTFVHRNNRMDEYRTRTLKLVKRLKYKHRYQRRINKRFCVQLNDHHLEIENRKVGAISYPGHAEHFLLLDDKVVFSVGNKVTVFRNLFDDDSYELECRIEGLSLVEGLVYLSTDSAQQRHFLVDDKPLAVAYGAEAGVLSERLRALLREFHLSHADALRGRMRGEEARDYLVRSHGDVVMSCSLDGVFSVRHWVQGGWCKSYRLSEWPMLALQYPAQAEVLELRTAHRILVTVAGLLYSIDIQHD